MHLYDDAETEEVTTFTYGACGHPLRIEPGMSGWPAHTWCRVCWLLDFSIDRTTYDPRRDLEDRLLYYAEQDREVAEAKWRGREDEANEHEYFATTPVERPANNAQHDLVICLSGQVLRDAIGWTWREVPFYASRYHASGEPIAPYLNPHREVKIEMHGWYTTKARRSGDTTMRDLVGIFDEI